MGMKKTKVLLTALILVFHCMSFDAFAETIDVITLDAGKIKVSGTADADTVSFKVYGQGKSGIVIGEICELGEADVKNGIFSITFNMPEFIDGSKVDGTYTVDVSGGTRASKDFVFAAYSYQNEFVNKVNAKASAADMEELFSGRTDDNAHDNLTVMNNLGVDTDYYSTLDSTEKAKLAKTFLNEKGSAGITADTFNSIYKKAETVQYVNKNALSGSWLETSAFEFENVAYKDIESDSLKEWIPRVLNNSGEYAKFADIEKKYREANVLYLLNNGKYTDYDTLIGTYDDAIGIGAQRYYTEYKGMNAADKSKVNSKVRETLSQSPALSAENFKNIYSSAVDNVRSASGNYSGGGGGGGGGGGSSSGGGSGGGGAVVSRTTGIGSTNMIVPEPYDPTKDRPKFNDIAGVDWAEEAIIALAMRGVVSGYDEYTFKPLQNITREEFIKMVVNALGIGLNASAAGFEDVDQDAWYAPYVNAAYERGIIKGISDTEFGVGREIKREDMAVIIGRLANGNTAAEQKEPFADDADIADYAKEAVYSLYNAGRLSGIGDNMFGPKQIVNRAQAAKLIYDTLAD